MTVLSQVFVILMRSSLMSEEVRASASPCRMPVSNNSFVKSNNVLSLKRNKSYAVKKKKIALAEQCGLR